MTLSLVLSLSCPSWYAGDTRDIMQGEPGVGD